MITAIPYEGRKYDRVKKQPGIRYPYDLRIHHAHGNLSTVAGVC